MCSCGRLSKKDQQVKCWSIWEKSQCNALVIIVSSDVFQYVQLKSPVLCILAWIILLKILRRNSA